MDNICQQILPTNNTRLRGIGLSLDSTCHEVLMLWMTNHDSDLSCVHCMLSIKVRSQCYISITHAQHIINLFIDLTWHIQTLGRCTSVPTSLIYHGLKFINQNNVVHQLRYYLNSTTVSNKQSKSTTNNLSRTWWGPSIIMSTDDTMDVGMTVLRWFFTVQ